MSADDPDDPRAAPVDVDRAAILARRQRFIALALSGLASACTSNERPARPQACLKYSIEPREKPGGTKPDPHEPSDTALPVPCLSLPAEPPPPIEDPKATPQPCLSPLPGPAPKPDTPPKPPKPVPCLEVMPTPDDEK